MGACLGVVLLQRYLRRGKSGGPPLIDSISSLLSVASRLEARQGVSEEWPRTSLQANGAGKPPNAFSEHAGTER